MSMLRGFLTLVLCFMLGEALRLVFLIPVSGGVLGMILMTITLMLLIMPGVVGVFFSADQFSGQWLAVAGALLVGTFLSVLTTLLLMASLVKAGQRRASDD